MMLTLCIDHSVPLLTSIPLYIYEYPRHAYTQTACSYIEIVYDDDFNEAGQPMVTFHHYGGVEVLPELPDKYVAPKRTRSSIGTLSTPASSDSSLKLDASSSSAMISGAKSTPPKPLQFPFLSGLTGNAYSMTEGIAYSPGFTDGGDLFGDSFAVSDSPTSSLLKSPKVYKDVFEVLPSELYNQDAGSGSALFSDNNSFGGFTSSSAAAAVAAASDNSFNVFDDMTSTSARAAAVPTGYLDDVMLSARQLIDPAAAAAAAAAAAEPAAVVEDNDESDEEDNSGILTFSDDTSPASDAQLTHGV
jgi:hypothetical protein